MAIKYHLEYHIVIWHSSGLLKISEVIHDIEQIAKLEEKEPPFHYFANVSDCDLSEIKFAEVRKIYLLRKAKLIIPNSKTAIFVKSNLQYGVARIYQTLMSDTTNAVEVHKNQNECSEFLNVPVEILFSQT